MIEDEGEKEKKKARLLSDANGHYSNSERLSKYQTKECLRKSLCKGKSHILIFHVIPY